MMQGQGKPLPDFMQLDGGEWVLENVVFLHHSGTGGQVDFTRAAEREDGALAMGFDCRQLADAFGIDSAALVEANRVGRLVYAGTVDVAPQHGGTNATAYVFRLDGKEVAPVVETYPTEGRS